LIPRQPPRYQKLGSRVFTIIYAAEFVLRVLALVSRRGHTNRQYVSGKGRLHRADMMMIGAQGLRGYFSDWWSLIDVVVLLESLVDTINLGLGGLKTLRLLRPLRTFRQIPAVRKIVDALLNSAPSLRDIVAIFIFYILIVSIFGQLLFQGLLQNQCVHATTGDPYLCPEPASDWVFICGQQFVEGAEAAKCYTSLEVTKPQRCPSGYVCRGGQRNPNLGVTSFDNLPLAMMTFFQVTTAQDWSELLYYTQEALSPYTIYFFVLIILTGTAALMNLMIAGEWCALDKLVVQTGCHQVHVH
jgi:hypothetical protein